MKLDPCPHCGVSVVPTSERECPSCRRSFDDPPIRPAKLAAAESTASPNPYQSPLADVRDAERKSTTDPRVARQIDMLYRRVKWMPKFGWAALVFPVLLPVAILLAFYYMYLRSRLLRALEERRIIVDSADDAAAAKPGEPSTLGKLDYVFDESGRLWHPMKIAGVLFVLFVVTMAVLNG